MAGRNNVKVGLALLAVYLIWGSTYLALKVGLEGFPPFLMNSLRFLVAGTALFVVLRARGHAAPTRKQWWNVARMGMLLLVGGVGLVTVAEDHGVGSGVAAMAVAAMPLWAAIIGGLFGKWPARREWIGFAIGFSGVLVLAQEGDLQATISGMVLVIVAPILWAFGSVWGSRLDLPGTPMTTAGALLVAGAALAVIGPLRGERITAMPSPSSWLAVAYLAIFGSIIAYSSYLFLLKAVRPALATSYAYVNPVVAVTLGLTLGSETLTGSGFVALPLILAGVAMVVAPKRKPDHRLVRRPRLQLQPARRAA